jgi:dienelactone hydrolase
LKSRETIAPFRPLIQRLKQRHFAFSFQHFSYEGAGHVLAGASQLAPARPIGASDIAIGGTENANTAARNDAWAKVCAFFSAYLK